MIKLLWITNVPTPNASIYFGTSVSNFGGWLNDLSYRLENDRRFLFGNAFPCKDINLKSQNKKLSNYYIIPSDLNALNFENRLDIVFTKFKPDLVHIFGTEFIHSYFVSLYCKNKGIKFIITMQGTLFYIAQNFLADLPKSVVNKYTLKEKIKNENLTIQKSKLVSLAKFELETIKNTKYIIGRTKFDFEYIKSINKNIEYFHVNETLRKGFYSEKWDYNKCEKYSIYISQFQYPFKGFHYFLYALPELIKKYPSIKVYVSGYNLFNKGFLALLKFGSYEKYLSEIIKKHNLSKYLIFTGLLTEKKVIEILLKSNVFLLPSVIENSPNSLGEAMILGVPSISSKVGGIQNFVVNNFNGFLYNYSSKKELIDKIDLVFSNNDFIKMMSKNSINTAKKIYDSEVNYAKLTSIYFKIFNGKLSYGS